MTELTELGQSEDQGTAPGQGTFIILGTEQAPETARWVAEGLRDLLDERGHTHLEPSDTSPRFVLNVIDPNKPRGYRRRRQATFVMSVVELDGPVEDPLRTGYPMMLRALSNLLLILDRSSERLLAHFVTIEQGYYTVEYTPGEDRKFFEQLYERFEPLASSELVINNIFHEDLEPELWEGDDLTRQISDAGKKLDTLGLLPGPFPVEEILGPQELRHVYLLYGLGGLSYGNLSARKDERRFWMSASGVNKSDLKEIGRDFLLVKNFDESRPAIELSVPPNVQPRRASVDAIEHWMIYQEHPDVGAIMHVHAWMDGIRATDINYPCGTREIAQSVADLIRQEPNPGRAIIGQRNHGVTITGPSMDEILERIEGKLIPQVPMS